MRALIFAALATAAVAGPALAQQYMAAAEARRTFFGLDMEGVHQPSGERWRECIDRAGRTTYWFGGAIDEGRLTVRNDGALCFSYKSSQFRDSSCWRIRPQGRGAFRFENAEGATGVFVTTATRRVAGCSPQDAPVS